MNDTRTPQTNTNAPAITSRTTYRDALLAAHLRAVTRSDALAVHIRRGAASVSTSEDAAVLFDGLTHRMALRIAAYHPAVSYAMAKLPPGYWRWKR